MYLIILKWNHTITENNLSEKLIMTRYFKIRYKIDGCVLKQHHLWINLFNSVYLWLLPNDRKLKGRVLGDVFRRITYELCVLLEICIELLIIGHGLGTESTCRTIAFKMLASHYLWQSLCRLLLPDTE